MDNLIKLTIENYGIVAGTIAIALLSLGGFVASVLRDSINLKNKHKNDENLKAFDIQNTIIKQINEHNLIIERYATQLSHANLIERRADVIDNIYKLMVELHEVVYTTIRPDYFGRPTPSIHMAYELALPKLDKFIEQYEKNKIYFSYVTSQILSKFHYSAMKALNQARIASSTNENKSASINPELQKLFEEINGNMTKAREAVENEFRNILYTANIPKPSTN